MSPRRLEEFPKTTRAVSIEPMRSKKPGCGKLTCLTLDSPGHRTRGGTDWRLESVVRVVRLVRRCRSPLVELERLSSRHPSCDATGRSHHRPGSFRLCRDGKRPLDSTSSKNTWASCVNKRLAN